MRRAPFARCARLAVALSSTFVVAAGGAALAEPVTVLVGAGGGVVNIDLPDADEPGETYGSRGRVHFEIDLQPIRWLEVGAEVGFAPLGGSDSLDAILVGRGQEPSSTVTHVQGGATLRLRRGLGSRWTAFLRAGLGAAGVWASAPEDLGGHEVDFAWNAGAGVDLEPHSRLRLRAEGLYLGQAASPQSAHHAAGSLALLLAFGAPRSDR